MVLCGDSGVDVRERRGGEGVLEKWIVRRHGRDGGGGGTSLSSSAISVVDDDGAWCPSEAG